MSSTLFIPVLYGSSRSERKTYSVAPWVVSRLKQRGIATELVDVRELNLPFYEEAQESLPAAKRWSETMQKADGLIVISPEYNHSFPGVLKNTIDYLYDEYSRKPVGIIGASGGLLGGARVVEQLRLVTIDLKMVPIRNAVYVGFVREAFDEHGNPVDDAFNRRLNTMLEELVWYAQVLKTGREQVPYPKHE